MTENKQSNFEGWAIVDLFGYHQEAGFVRTELLGQTAFLRIDAPEIPPKEYVLEDHLWMNNQLVVPGSKVRTTSIPARTRLVGAGAVFAINPATEEEVRQFLAEKRVPAEVIEQADHQPTTSEIISTLPSFSH